mgnify:CR=1 FL=1
MGGLLFDEGDDLGSLVADHGEERREVGGGAAVLGAGAEALEAVGGGGVELERDAERRGEGGEVAPGLPDGGGRVSDAGEPQRGRAAGARGERLEERRPLVALEDVEVDDVDAVLAVERLEDGLVGGEVGELDVGAGLVEDLVDLERLRRRRERVGGGGAGGGGGGGGGGEEGEASGEGVGEVGGDALHGVAERGGDAAEEVEVAERRRVVALGDEVGARQQEVHQLKPTVLLLQIQCMQHC